MKKSFAVLGTILTAGMLTVPVYASDSPSVYISGDAGSSWFNDIKPKDPLTNTEGPTITTTAGINVLGALGVKWCDNYRLEAEFGYQRNNADKYTHGPMVVDLPGNFSVTSYTANGYYDFKAGGVNPYLTAGIGLAQVGVHGVPNPPDIINETHSALGYQFGAGLSIPLNKNVDFDVRYRYYRTSSVNLDNNGGEFQISSNSILAGLRVGL